MADLLGVSLRQYQRWERGSSHPSARALERIKRTLAGEHAPDNVLEIAQHVASLESEVRTLRAELDALRAQHA